MIPRLAGWALKGLTGAGSKGAMKIGGRTLGSLGREALTDTALLYGASQVPNAIGTGLSAADGSLSSDRLEELAGTKKQGGKYKITTQDKVGNVVSDLASKLGIGDGAQVTQDTVSARAQSNLENEYKDLYSQFGGVLTPGADRGALARGLSDLKIADAERRLKGSLGYQNTERERLRRDSIENITYNDSRKDAALARAAADRSEGNRLSEAMAKLQFEQGQADRKFDYDNRVLDYEQNLRKSDRRAKILSALGGLGMMFAI